MCFLKLKSKVIRLAWIQIRNRISEAIGIREDFRIHNSDIMKNPHKYPQHRAADECSNLNTTNSPQLPFSGGGGERGYLEQKPDPFASQWWESHSTPLWPGPGSRGRPAWPRPPAGRAGQSPPPRTEWPARSTASQSCPRVYVHVATKYSTGISIRSRSEGAAAPAPPQDTRNKICQLLNLYQLLFYLCFSDE